MWYSESASVVENLAKLISWQTKQLSGLLPIFYFLFLESFFNLLSEKHCVFFWKLWICKIWREIIQLFVRLLAYIQLSQHLNNSWPRSELSDLGCSSFRRKWPVQPRDPRVLCTPVFWIMRLRRLDGNWYTQLYIYLHRSHESWVLFGW